MSHTWVTSQKNWFHGKFVSVILFYSKYICDCEIVLGGPFILCLFSWKTLVSHKFFQFLTLTLVAYYYEASFIYNTIFCFWQILSIFLPISSGLSYAIMASMSTRMDSFSVEFFVKTVHKATRLKQFWSFPVICFTEKLLHLGLSCLAFFDRNSQQFFQGQLTESIFFTIFT